MNQTLYFNTKKSSHIAKRAPASASKRSLSLFIGAGLSAALVFLLAFTPSATTDILTYQRSIDTSTAMSDAQLAASINTFGDKLFSCFASDTKQSGRFISSWGIAHALSMLLSGAKPGSASLDQLRSIIFGVSTTTDQAATDNAADGSSLQSLHNDIHTLTTSILSGNGNPESELEVSDANSAWIRKELTLQKEFADSLQKYFNADTGPLETAAIINNWVSEATRGKITSIVEDDVVKRAAMILINAIYFKAKWQIPFTKGETRAQMFTLLDGTTQRTPMMYRCHERGPAIEVSQFTTTTSSSSEGGEGGGYACTAVKLLYKGGQYSAIAAMPDLELDANNVDAYKTALSSCHTHLLKALKGIKDSTTTSTTTTTDEASLKWVGVGNTTGIGKIKLYMPRFEIEYSVALGEILRSIGITAPFGVGDLTQIAKDSAGNAVTDLVVSEVVHKVYCKVDEQGTEAAAVTGIMMMRAAIMKPVDEMVVRFEKPFVFSVVHGESGLALFSGEVYQPETWKDDPAGAQA